MKKTVFSKNKPVFSFETDENNRVTNVLQIENTELLPIILKGEGHFNSKNVSTWLSARRIPVSRDEYQNVERMFPIRINSGNHLFSLNDQFWIKEAEDEAWEDLNFFTNHYETDYGRMFFSPWTVKRENLTAESPDMTTGGVCAKRWCQPDQESHISYLIKKGSTRGHQDPLFEIISSVTLEKLNIIPFVKYEYVIDGLSVCSKCKNFITENTEYVPALHVLKYEDRPEGVSYYEHFIKMCGKFGISHTEDFLDRMFLADAILMNDDRNFLNFGFIRDANNGKLISFAPLFDNGSVLLCEPRERKTWFEETYISAGVKRALNFIDRLKIFDTIKKEVFRIIDDYPFFNPDLKRQMIEKLSQNYRRFEAAIKPAERKKAVPAGNSLKDFAMIDFDSNLPGE